MIIKGLVLTNSVPAVAVIQRERALFVFTGRNFNIFLILKNLSILWDYRISNVGVKSIDIRKNTSK